MDKLQEDNKALKGLVQDLIRSDTDLKNTFNEYIKEQREEDKKKQTELEDKVDVIKSQLKQEKLEKKGFWTKLFGGN